MDSVRRHCGCQPALLVTAVITSGTGIRPGARTHTSACSLSCPASCPSCSPASLAPHCCRHSTLPGITFFFFVLRVAFCPPHVLAIAVHTHPYTYTRTLQSRCCCISIPSPQSTQLSLPQFLLSRAVGCVLHSTSADVSALPNLQDPRLHVASDIFAPLVHLLAHIWHELSLTLIHLHISDTTHGPHGPSTQPTPSPRPAHAQPTPSPRARLGHWGGGAAIRKIVSVGGGGRAAEAREGEGSGEQKPHLQKKFFLLLPEAAAGGVGRAPAQLRP